MQFLSNLNINKDFPFFNFILNKILLIIGKEINLCRLFVRYHYLMSLINRSTNDILTNLVQYYPAVYLVNTYFLVGIEESHYVYLSAMYCLIKILNKIGRYIYIYKLFLLSPKIKMRLQPNQNIRFFNKRLPIWIPNIKEIQLNFPFQYLTQIFPLKTHIPIN